MRPQPLSRRSRGYVLVYFAMLAFVLMAVAALVIDVGFVFVTRRQMQAAADSSALEGLRLRDGVPSQWNAPNNPGMLDPSIVTAMQNEGLDPTNPDSVRRWAAQQDVVNTFDDNLNPADGDPSSAVTYQGGPANFGAGPVLNFTDSAGIPPGGQAIAASQTISPGTPTVYKPSDSNWPFQINPNNDVTGDMVGGNYTFNPSNYGLTTSRAEDDTYNRTDFQAITASPVNSFLVRMKRSNESSSNAPISSSGPPVPYLFGRGSLLTTQQRGGNTAWAKGQGITVRATSIANAVPALSVGPSIANLPISDGQQTVTLNLQGIAPFGLSLAFWQTMQAGGSVSDMVQSSGQISPTATASGDGFIARLTTLATSVGASDTTLTVKSTQGFPSPSDYTQPAAIAPFTVRIENELMRVTAGAGTTTWTVERGAFNTQAAPHQASGSNNAPTPVTLMSRGHEVTITNPDGSTQDITMDDPPAVGQPLAGSLPDGLVFPLDGTSLFVPIYETITDPANNGRSVIRIIGFGEASMTSNATRPYSYPITVSITQKSSVIASQNATSRFVPSWDNLTAGELSQILGPTGVNSTFPNSLLTPALVRSE